MTDINDDVTVSTTVTVNGVLTTPSDVDLVVTAPDGTESSPSVNNPSTGLYQATVTPDAAGRWRYKWTTTSPDAVDFGHFDVQANPPARLDPLASVSDLEARVGSLTADQAARAGALLVDASAQVRSYCRQDFDLVEDDTVVLRPIGNELTLPQRPVLAVSSVTALSGQTDVADVTLSGWQWDGIDTINLYGLSAVVVNLPEWFNDIGSGPGTYRVTYDHGYTTTPDDLIGIVCGMVNRVLTAPTMTEGYQGERAGPFGYTMAAGQGTPGPAVRLAKADKDALAEAGYRRTSGTIQLRA